MAGWHHPARPDVARIGRKLFAPMFAYQPGIRDNPKGHALAWLFVAPYHLSLHNRNANTQPLAHSNESHLCILYAGRIQVKYRCCLPTLEPGMDNFVVANVDAGMKESVSTWIAE